MVEASLWPPVGDEGVRVEEMNGYLTKQTGWYLMSYQELCIVHLVALSDCHQRFLLFPAPSLGYKKPCCFANGEILEKQDTFVSFSSSVSDSLKENTRGQ